MNLNDSRPDRHSSRATAAGVIVVVACLSATCAGSGSSYFSCDGRTGIANSQSSLPLLSKEIVSNDSRVEGSMEITAENVTIDGIPFVAGSYRICQNDDQILWFSPSGSRTECAANDTFGDLGAFNKINGTVHYHVGDFLAVLRCTPSKKLVK